MSRARCRGPRRAIRRAASRRVSSSKLAVHDRVEIAHVDAIEQLVGHRIPRIAHRLVDEERHALPIVRQPLGVTQQARARLGDLVDLASS